MTTGFTAARMSVAITGACHIGKPFRHRPQTLLGRIAAGCSEAINAAIGAGLVLAALGASLP
jgi:hypothetical protein